MTVEIEVTRPFIIQRNQRAKIYKPRGRTKTKQLMDIDCEIYEWHMINTNQWEDEPNDWKIDGYIPTPEGRQAIDVKFITKWYNIPNYKMCNLLQQRNVLDGYFFCEWATKPSKPLTTGDRVDVRPLGFLSTGEILDNVRASNYGGHFVDVRKLLQA